MRNKNNYRGEKKEIFEGGKKIEKKPPILPFID